MCKLKNSVVVVVLCMALNVPLCRAEGVVDQLEELDRLKRENALLRQRVANKELERKLNEPTFGDPRNSLLPPSLAHLQGPQNMDSRPQDSAPGMRVISIQGFDGRMTATLSLGNGQYVTVSTGDELADKSRVTSISSSAVYVSHGARKMRLPFADATPTGASR